jgi:hypothetical protein
MAWLQGELPRAQSDDYDQHVQECEPCTEFVNDARVLLVRLHREAAERRAGGTHGMAVVEQRILQHCEPDLGRLQAQARGRARRGAAAAAAVLLLTVTAHVGLRAVRGGDDDTLAAAAGLPAVTASDASAHWIAEQLGPDGRFDAASWSGPRNEEIAMHGLALLALARAGNESAREDDGAERSAEVLRGARWLIDQQDADGTLGGEGGGLSHAVATVALLEASELTGEGAVRRAAERAVARIAATQLTDGGWQPHAPARGCDPARTAWALQALLRAEQLKVRGLCKSIARGRSRLAADLGGLRRPDELDLQAVARLALGATGPGAAGALAPASNALAAADAVRAQVPGLALPQPTCDRADVVTRPAGTDTAPDELLVSEPWAAPYRIDDLYVASVAVLSALPLPR